jgi:hypothetical protein
MCPNTERLLHLDFSICLIHELRSSFSYPYCSVVPQSHLNIKPVRPLHTAFYQFQPVTWCNRKKSTSENGC